MIRRYAHRHRNLITSAIGVAFRYARAESNLKFRTSAGKIRSAVIDLVRCP